MHSSEPQQPRSSLHEPPKPRQHTFTPPMLPQVRPSVQHPGAAAPGVHRAASPSMHAAGAWQRPLTQSSVPQQPSELVHDPPAALQHRFVPTTSWQARPPAQQLGAAAPTVHVAASARPQVAAAWQRPLTQSSDPQQPAEVVHAPPVLLQQRLVPDTDAQLRPPAQQLGAVPVVVHAAASASPQVAVAARHVPPMQVVPAQHSVPLAQVAPSGWQQRPPSQTPSPQQP